MQETMADVKQDDVLMAENPEAMSDRMLDESFRNVLKNGRLGQILDPDIVAHLDFFHNTLNFDHKAQTENPFENT